MRRGDSTGEGRLAASPHRLNSLAASRRHLMKYRCPLPVAIYPDRAGLHTAWRYLLSLEASFHRSLICHQRYILVQPFYFGVGERKLGDIEVMHTLNGGLS